jgi:hypothetical protein
MTDLPQTANGGTTVKIRAKRSPFGIVLLANPAFSRSDTATAHLVLDRYMIDADSNICVTPPMPIADLADSIELLKAKLDALLRETGQLMQVRHQIVADGAREPEERKAARA